MTLNLKNSLRKKMKQIRAIAYEKDPDASANLIRLFHAHISLSKNAIIAAYSPIHSELDILPLLHHLHKTGHSCCLPVASETAHEFLFKKWVPESIMIQGAFHIPVPEQGELINPDVLLVPLLAFDTDGYRLGYGKGHYDTTLIKLKNTGKIVTIGIGYEVQKVDCVPREPHDQQLDWIITEQKAYKIT